MASRLSAPQLQYLDQYGNPLSGGQLFFYQSGTSTPAATYADAGLDIPNANPIVLDSSGSCPAPFLTVGQLYKIVLQDANGATVYTVDPVSDATSTGDTVTSSLAITDDAGTPRSLFLQTDGENRFGIALDAVSETGNNVGSNLNITTYNDDGSANAIVMTINRSSGVVNFASTPTFGGQNILPSGMIAPFAMATAPNGWLACDGSSYKRSSYPALFNAIGTTYGQGSDTTTYTTFAVPDPRGAFIRALDGGKGLDPNRALGSYQADAIVEHVHNQVVYSALTTAQASGQSNIWQGNPGNTQTTGGALNAGGAPIGAAETRPKNYALFYCIKT